MGENLAEFMVSVLSRRENKGLNDWLMARAGHPAGCLFAAVALLCGLFQKRCLLRWVNFKTIINQEKPSNQRLCIAETETIENSARYSHHASRQQTGHGVGLCRAGRSPERASLRALVLCAMRCTASRLQTGRPGLSWHSRLEPHPAKATPRTTRVVQNAPSASTPQRSKV